MNFDAENFALAEIRRRAENGSDDPNFYDLLLAELDERARRWETPPLTTGHIIRLIANADSVRRNINELKAHRA